MKYWKTKVKERGLGIESFVCERVKISRAERHELQDETTH